jgi:hypothetical protein
MKVVGAALPVPLTRYAGYRAGARPAPARTHVNWRQFGSSLPS